MSFSSFSPIGFRDLNTTAAGPANARYSGNQIDDFADFKRLVTRWRAETYFFPSVHEKIDHYAFGKIVAMGRKTIPWIVQEIRETPDFLVMALGFLVTDNPIPASIRGRIDQIIDFWLMWAARTCNVD